MTGLDGIYGDVVVENVTEGALGSSPGDDDADADDEKQGSHHAADDDVGTPGGGARRRLLVLLGTLRALPVGCRSVESGSFAGQEPGGCRCRFRCISLRTSCGSGRLCRSDRFGCRCGGLRTGSRCIVGF